MPPIHFVPWVATKEETARFNQSAKRVQTISEYKEITAEGEKRSILEIAGDAEFIGKDNRCFYLTHVVSPKQKVGTIHLHVAKQASARNSCHPENWSTAQYFHYNDIPVESPTKVAEFAILDLNGDGTLDIAFHFASGALIVFHAKKP